MMGFGVAFQPAGRSLVSKAQGMVLLSGYSFCEVSLVLCHIVTVPASFTLLVR